MKTAERTVDRHVVLFASALRSAGLSIPLHSTLEFGRALAEVGIDQRDRVYWAGRTTLIRRPEDISLYDQVFEQHWLGSLGLSQQDTVTTEVTLMMDQPQSEEEQQEGQESKEDNILTVRWSPTEVLSTKDFAECSSEELTELHKLMANFCVAAETRRCRRLRPSRRSGRLNLRRTVRAALKTEGEALRRERHEPGERHRRLVFLLDVSGSMEPYARALIRFVHAAIASRNQVEAFALGTRLTRLTQELSTRDPDIALSKVAQAVEDWSGGTRLGDGLGRFNDEWGVRGMARGAIVVVLSDGWDRGDPAVMTEQMQRLARVVYRMVWVNPLKSTPGYAPLAQGMAAALPYIDEFLEGHNLESLDNLVKAITRT